MTVAERKLVNRLVECYKAEPAKVAKAIDEIIDRSGNLLGYLRDASTPKSAGDVEAMREACAKVADSWCAADYSDECNILADSIAREIRSLPVPRLSK